jgi:pimeloyl-ACP methyl ester carboxylesterase
MAYVTAGDGVKLHVTETGAGTPIVFVHEFAGDERSWEPQVRFFSRRYRCVTFNARGYPPSDVPEDGAAYSQARAVDDIRDVMNGLDHERAHIVGLSMGGFATLHFGLTYPARAYSLVIAGAGYGAEKHLEDAFRENSRETARQFETLGSEKFSYVYGYSASRIPFLVKDPRGFEEFRRMLGEHSARGSANTMRGVQAGRPSIYDLKDRMTQMQVPALVVTGDEDDHCLQPALFMKSVIPACGLAVLPKTGHTLNLEEPALFNWHVADFLAQVEQGRWAPRDPRSIAAEIMKTTP